MMQSKSTDLNNSIAANVQAGYDTVETTIVDAYKKLENDVVSSYQKIEDAFVKRYLARNGETVEEAKKRVQQTTAPQKSPIDR